MKIRLTIIEKLMRMPLVGQTEVGSAEVQPARDNQPKATNCRWGGSCIFIIYISAISLYEQRQFRAFRCLKKTALPKARQSLNSEVDLSNSR